MSHADKAYFRKQKIIQTCKNLEVDYEEFREECELLDGKLGNFNRWKALVMDEEGYDFLDDNGKYHFVPAQLVEEDWFE